ncbi:hypothetical protein CMQ_7005 [Grosmannia clavigera kw1407]|uniref:Uncharacterized protein n=1 Tax=Grosmannia clavigera (strain kw1407 / UAMH 11150) TaxID=655863 RepID=F0X7R6_GROCL|nr:uncharacterized protein CMQ_7005 [Grosmannia clavigera kw1407]EFX06684.1 hypothetical protein CMQ_7005 [Grosmannia clavigera kw1407]
MFATKVLRQAAQHAERTPLIKFTGRRTIPTIDHAARNPHPASPTGSLPSDFAAASSHSSFSSYRDHVQQFGPLRKTIRSLEERGIGGSSGHELGTVAPSVGEVFDRNDLPARFRRAPLSAAEIEAVETGGATLFA